MRIDIIFTSNEEKDTFNSFVRSCNFKGNVFTKIKNMVNDICDQMSIDNLSNGTIITIDDNIVTKFFQFCESKIGTAKRIFYMFNDTIEDYVDMIKQNVTHRTKMVNHCKQQFAENKYDDVEFIFCTYTDRGMETRYIRTGYEFTIYEENILEAVLCDQAGMISDDIEEIKALIDEHNKPIKEANEKKEFDEEALQHRMVKEAEFRRIDEEKYGSGKNMVMALCYYDNEPNDEPLKTEHITIIPIFENEPNYDVFAHVVGHDHIMLVDLKAKYNITHTSNIISWINTHNKCAKSVAK